jgi:hypothetical protein
MSSHSYLGTLQEIIMFAEKRGIKISQLKVDLDFFYALKEELGLAETPATAFWAAGPFRPVRVTAT